MLIDTQMVETLCAADPMLTKLVTWANEHPEVRAAVLNGSRANPNAPRDRWQDYDFNIAERTPDFFYNHPEFLDEFSADFGARVIMQRTHGYQTPTGWLDVSEDEYQAHLAAGTHPGIHHYNLMIIYAEGADGSGIRVDFSFVPANRAAETYTDSMTLPLVDKDGLIPALPTTSDSGYLVQPPTPARFNLVRNELFWLSTYVAKGLLRGEIVYAQSLMAVLCEQLVELLNWHVGTQTNWSVNTGYRGKWLQRFLAPDEWQALLATYAGSDLEAQWQALFAATSLARRIGQPLAETLRARYGEGFDYNLEEDERTVAFLSKLHAEQA